MCAYLPWILGTGKDSGQDEQTPALHDVHPQHVANRKVRTEVSQRDRSGLQVRRFGLERALTSERCVILDKPLSFREPQFPHRKMCMSQFWIL